MTQQTENLYIDLNPQELQKISKQLADIIIEAYAKQLKPNETATILTTISGTTIIKEDQLTQVINLELLASTTHGWTDPLGQMWNAITSFFWTVADWITSGITTFINQYVIPAISGVTTAVTGFMNQYVIPALNLVNTTLGGFVNAILKFPEWFTQCIVQPLINFFTQTVPDFFLNTFLPTVVGFFQWIWNNLCQIGSWIWSGLTAIFNIFQQSLSLIMPTLPTLVTIAWQTLISTIQSSIQILYTAYKTFVEAIFNPALDLFADVATALVAPLLESTIKDFQIPTTEYFSSDYVKSQVHAMQRLCILIFFLPLYGQLLPRALKFYSGSIGRFLENIADKLLVHLRPVGIGAEARFSIVKAIGASIYTFSCELLNYTKTIGRGITYGWAIWFSRPFAQLANLYTRNFIPIYIPQESQIIEMMRRAMPTDKLENYRKIMAFYLSLQGASDITLHQFLAKPEDYSITVKDRFQKDRTVPLALIYDLPSATDVATMMVRDLFASLEDFQKLYSARGMHPEVGKLYYLLRFRYPPPERLWTFTMRGISGLLWSTHTKEMLATATKEAENIGAYPPTDAYDLNFQSTTLLQAFQTYMKWHDYATFSWIKNFPSDNQIIIDTLADIPTKIDQRWLVKWGIYEYLSAKGVRYDSPVDEFATKILETTPASKIQLDLTNFSRTLQATGLHPDWVPATAIAETMNVLTEERTLIRGGFLNLFKEGYYTLTALDKMLSGFITASFQVAWFNTDTLKWQTGWVNLPVQFLPPERKLIELRALTDRAYDILKEIQKDISTAYQEHIIWDYNEYKSKLTDVINSINQIYAKDYEAITGQALPPELQLSFVEDYYKPYVEALQIWRNVFTIRRIRMWTQRWLGWIMYRVAYGVVAKEDVEKLVELVKTKAKLTETEEDFIKQVLDIMYGIAQRTTVNEYLPTPTTLATLSEYITLPTDLVKDILTKRGIPEEWINIWLTYIQTKPLKTDAKALLSTYVRAFRNEAIAKQELDTFIKALAKYGFTTEEINMIQKQIELEEAILTIKENKQQYVPTLATIASMLEYVHIPSETIQKVYEARNVPKTWQDVWNQYFAIRPIADDARILATAYYQAKRYQINLGDLEKQVTDILTTSGMTAQELKIRDLASAIANIIDEFKENRREYIPTPSMLATIVEIIPEARELFDDIVKERRIPQAWQPVWAKYIDYKPILPEVKKWLGRAENLYEYFAITEDNYKQVLDSIKYLGWTDAEIEFMLLSSRYQRWLRAYRELIGDIDRMVTISNYSPKAEQFALGNLYKMIDALPVDAQTKEIIKTMWEQFIRNRHVKDEVITYVRDLVNLYIYERLSRQDLEAELIWLEDWGLSTYEREFWLRIADARKAKRLGITLAFTPTEEGGAS